MAPQPKPPSQPDLLNKDIDIPPSTWLSQSDQSILPVIQFPQILPDATGIALATFQQASNIIKNTAVLSTRPLAILVPTATELPTSTYSPTRVSCAYVHKQSQQPIILDSWLIQLGAINVVRATTQGSLPTSPQATTVWFITHRDVV